MPEKRVVPVIASLADFESKLSGYLDPNTPLALLLDYDGTLSGIADNPASTFLTANMKKLLHELAAHPQIFMAIISGRGLRDVQSCLGIKGITYAGNHGLEIESGDGTRHDYALPAELQRLYTTIVNELTEKLENNGAWVEDKKVSLTFHYRDVAADAAEQYKQAAKAIIESHGFRANQAHMAIEAKPPVNWNKGEAALLILKNQFGEDWAKKIKVIFAGDDTTDEDAMRLLQGSGISFRVSTDPNIETYADFRLARQPVVEDLMAWINNTHN
uniref:Trehalose 6-phosphate phosphatase n=1 Tax=Zeugodacus cucurbitae TaxID=28588 RepID=A0A0A1WFB8_ZEUCU